MHQTHLSELVIFLVTCVWCVYCKLAKAIRPAPEGWPGFEPSARSEQQPPRSLWLLVRHSRSSYFIPSADVDLYLTTDTKTLLLCPMIEPRSISTRSR